MLKRVASISCLRTRVGYWVEFDDRRETLIWAIIESNFKNVKKKLRDAEVPPRVIVQIVERFKDKKAHISECFKPLISFKVNPVAL